MFFLYAIVMSSFVTIPSVDMLENLSANKRVAYEKKKIFSIFEPCAEKNYFEEKQFVEGKLIDLAKNDTRKNKEPLIEKPTEFSMSWNQGATDKSPKLG